MSNRGPILNAMTIDVEDYFHVQAFAHAIDRSKWNSMEYRAEANTHAFLSFFDKHSIKATFFVLGWVAQKSPSLIREIQSAGHEIACHGLSHRLVYEQTPEVFRQETFASKALLEDITGVKVSGYRAATYSITQKSLWALDILAEAGFEYDSSVFPIRHDNYGIPDASTAPGVIRTPSGHSLVEFPLSTASMFGIRLPVAGGGYFRIFPYALTRAGLNQINTQSGIPFVFYLHPWEVDPEQPMINAGWRSRLRHYTNLSRTLPRLEKLVSEFRFGTMKDSLAQMGLYGRAQPPQAMNTPALA
ncbi:XrtA system polysaccharide deacetylase [Peristeroidobacter agariperforans]|uniref:XrtA system polysaccharide deacetylase n=1 Tax=Peristeroidobacter agariperforans TaxID=268404 RepID=UPI00101C5408|nr:XrtA system polysaccharide deacetylase [Peristeroidobacter agariperforans]